MEISKDIINTYYNCLDAQCCCNYLPMYLFKEKYPIEYDLINKVNQRRNSIKKSINAMRCLGRNLYFGTLTFNVHKDRNKIQTKRRESFIKMNKIFEYFLLVEEYGETFNRYHVHIIGVLHYHKTFEDFRKCWHSRQNLKLINNNLNCVNYVMKYVAKDLPRVRRNKDLVALTNIFNKYNSIYNLFPKCEDFNPISKCLAYNFLKSI